MGEWVEKIRIRSRERMDATPRVSTNEPGSGNGNKTKGTGVAMVTCGGTRQ